LSIGGPGSLQGQNTLASGRRFKPALQPGASSRRCKPGKLAGPANPGPPLHAAIDEDEGSANTNGGQVATWIWVALGGALGSMARFWLAAAVGALTGPQFPWGTLLINVLGSFVIGLFGALTGTRGPVSVPPDIRIFVMVGICGGFTTFSSFSLQSLELLQAGEVLWAGSYIVGSVVLCLLGVWAGMALGHG
jgi:CrcB protein